MSEIKKCGNCSYWMKKHDCPLERGTMVGGPTANTVACDKFKLEAISEFPKRIWVDYDKVSEEDASKYGWDAYISVQENLAQLAELKQENERLRDALNICDRIIHDTKYGHDNQWVRINTTSVITKALEPRKEE
jgi:uncharacterized membrane protein